MFSRDKCAPVDNGIPLLFASRTSTGWTKRAQIWAALHGDARDLVHDIDPLGNQADGTAHTIDTVLTAFDECFLPRAESDLTAAQAEDAAGTAAAAADEEEEVVVTTLLLDATSPTGVPKSELLLTLSERFSMTMMGTNTPMMMGDSRETNSAGSCPASHDKPPGKSDTSTTLPLAGSPSQEILPLPAHSFNNTPASALINSGNLCELSSPLPSSIAWTSAQSQTPQSTQSRKTQL
jgi:hypothetical protein